MVVTCKLLVDACEIREFGSIVALLHSVESASESGDIKWETLNLFCLLKKDTKTLKTASVLSLQIKLSDNLTLTFSVAGRNRGCIYGPYGNLVLMTKCQAINAKMLFLLTFLSMSTERYQDLRSGPLFSRKKKMLVWRIAAVLQHGTDPERLQ